MFAANSSIDVVGCKGGAALAGFKVTKEISRKHSALRRSAEWRINMFVIFRSNTGSPYTTRPAM